jgi:hypothetical protein
MISAVNQHNNAYHYMTVKLVYQHNGTKSAQGYGGLASRLKIVLSRLLDT